MSDLWSWILTAVGLTCFFLAGRRVWWSWYVGIAGQALWLVYAVTSQQWGFLVGVFAYTFVYVGNAVRWTRERPPRRNYEDETRRAVHAEMVRRHSRPPTRGPEGGAGDSGASAV